MDIEVIENDKTGPRGIGHLQPATVFRYAGHEYYIKTDEDSAVCVNDGTLLTGGCFCDQEVEVASYAKMVIEL